MYYKCHNCGTGLGVANFLKSHFPSYHEQYLLEKYKSGVDTKKTRDVTESVPKLLLCSFSPKTATRLSELSDEHYAKQYILGRKIPRHYHANLYFADDFAALVEETFPGKYQNLPQNEPRLIIPFFDASNRLIGLQGRSFSPDRALRYITIRANVNVDLVYGLERINRAKTVYVVEGPLDSLFVPNCLAAANSDLSSAAAKANAGNVVLIFDNEPRNKEIVTLVEDAIRDNKKVCIWPSTLKHKDINDIVLSGTSEADLLSTIEKRTFCGLEAQLEFSKWKKI